MTLHLYHVLGSAAVGVLLGLYLAIAAYHQVVEKRDED